LSSRTCFSGTGVIIITVMFSIFASS
jgi:hypothetical protein